MNHTGEIDVISRAVEPTVSVITNIGTAHIGNLGSREKIARAKSEIVNGMVDKLSVIPYNEPLLSKLESKYTYSITHGKADCYIEPISINCEGSRFNAHTSRLSIYGLKTALVGEHVLNALAIGISIMDILGISDEIIKKAIEHADKAVTRGRFRMIGGFLVFDDTYSASADATIAVLKRLALEQGTKNAVLGDMLELGEHTKELHELVGSEVAKRGFTRLFAFGNFADYYANGAVNGGMSPSCIYINKRQDAPEITAADIIKSCRKGELLLVKASHAVNAEQIIEHLNKK
jgi:UDP-N-acetylmuramoyl-tripeptide--D-alanyl-D-alanine ligase